ncbi:MAG: formate dehydrogenase, alpha subunit [Deltaproteobacteria bacterium]|jgi:formate dehydrogenase major subunit|nr:formate dehydrogenase, alpha subunit [Deltaproteobacteria bacterium]
MKVTRRDFLVKSSTLVGGLALSSLGIDLSPVIAYAEEMKKIDKVKSARQTTSICCYCAVGCGLIASMDTKTGKIINVEGDPEHPISEGTLCAKGAGTYQTSAANEHRLTKVLYRAPNSDKWQNKSWDWAITEIAKRIKKTRDTGFIEKNSKDQVVNRTENIAHMGSSNVDNEECWLITAMARSMGLVFIDHQARV